MILNMNSKTIRLSFVISMFVIDVLKANENFVSPKDCGKTARSVPKSRLVGAVDVESPNIYPFMVSLQEFPNNHRCGGTILNKRWILTAAHCLYLLLLEVNFDYVVVGQVDISEISHINYRYSVEKYVINGCYFDGTQTMDNDIALIKTTQDIVFNNETIGAICLPEKDSNPFDNGVDVRIMGWGTKEQSGTKSSEVLQEIGSKQIPMKICQTYEYFRNVGFIWSSTEKQICIRSDDNTACSVSALNGVIFVIFFTIYKKGDSGGPAIQIIDGKAYQIGIASHLSAVKNFMSSFVETSSWCEIGNPVFYLKTSFKIDWIRDAIKTYGNRTDKRIKTKC